MYKMKGFNTQIAFCVLAAIVLLNVHFHICATAQATGTVSRSSTISRQAARVSRTPEFAVLARGGSSPPDPKLRTCAAATGFFGRGFKVIAKCDPKSWLAGGPYKLTSGPPANMKSTISQSNKELFVKLNGKLPTDYVTDTTARTGEATAEIIGHAHIGACDLTQAQLDGVEGLGSVTGAHFNFNTIKLGYGFVENEIWYTDFARPNGRVNYKSFSRQWGLPGDLGNVPSVTGLFRAGTEDDGVTQEIAANGIQGNVPGSTVLHAITDEGTTGDQWACCTLTYSKRFCDSIGGCYVYNKSTMEFDNLETLGRTF